MAYDHQEQEQLAEIKAWWDKNGNVVSWAAFAAVAALAAWNLWGWYERREAAGAGALYAELLRAETAHDMAKEKEFAGTLIEQHGRTVFAALAALKVAKANYEAGDAAAARAELQWVVDKSGRDDLALTARVRLAGLLLDAKDYDGALRTLDVSVPDSHAVIFADRRGDIYAAQGKTDLAREQWRLAIEKAGASNPVRSLVQSKLDALPNG
ncbi:MAG TPA: tetratricopeptide repeat protein [Burkholderiaceae bacterium]|nr:tetratricopeptide repeat protein [Burkholderiaceae bacterium]